MVGQKKTEIALVSVSSKLSAVGCYVMIAENAYYKAEVKRL